MKLRHVSVLLAALAMPAWAHQHPIYFDIVCSTSDAVPGLVLLPFLLLAGLGVVRAVVRHRKDRALSPSPSPSGRGKHRESLTRLVQ